MRSSVAAAGLLSLLAISGAWGWDSGGFDGAERTNQPQKQSPGRKSDPARTGDTQPNPPVNGNGSNQGNDRGNKVNQSTEPVISASPPMNETNAPPQDGPRAGETGSAEISASDAEENFPTVVQIFIAKRSVDGLWKYPEKGKTRRLKLLSVDADNLKNMGKNIYLGTAVFSDANGRRVKLPTSVDFSGSDWTVIAIGSAMSRGGPKAVPKP